MCHKNKEPMWCTMYLHIVLCPNMCNHQLIFLRKEIQSVFPHALYIYEGQIVFVQYWLVEMLDAAFIIFNDYNATSRLNVLEQLDVFPPYCFLITC